MKTSEVLRKAKDLIRTPSRWHKGAWGRMPFGKGWTLPQFRDLPCLCAGGAILRAYGEDVPGRSSLDGSEAGKYLGWVIDRGIPDFNDDPQTKHKDVMAAFDKAIELAEKRGD